MSKNEKFLWLAVALLAVWNLALTSYTSFWLSAIRAYLETRFHAKF
jgi:hypothetical protein